MHVAARRFQLCNLHVYQDTAAETAKHADLKAATVIILAPNRTGRGEWGKHLPKMLKKVFAGVTVTVAAVVAKNLISVKIDLENVAVA